MTSGGEILHIGGDEPRRLDPSAADGGLPPVVGVQSFQVFRASRDAPELTDGRGWTYHHHVDMACWKGRLYVGWNSCERDEDVWPSRELFSTSADGVNWSGPQEMFPQGISTCLRMYFYHAPIGRMLMIAGLRLDQRDTSEDRKGGLVVREIYPTHELGDVFTLQQPAGVRHCPPLFRDSGDAGFVVACESLLVDQVFLEQQDRGRLLGERGMRWHDASAWPGGRVPGDNEKWVCGKAWSFFRRQDGVRIGISKMGWMTTSTDDREWAQPHVPTTLVTGKAKVWAQQSADGRYALVYNPSSRQRYPLAIVTSDNGVYFDTMRIVQGELPIQRYEGTHRSIGPQYTRGISEWSTDASRSENVIWLVYSMSKEDIWVSRIPLPVQADDCRSVNNEPAEATGAIIPHWNTYQPKWASVAAERSPDDGKSIIRLRDWDPYDYARAQRVFAAAKAVQVEFDLLLEPADESAHFDVELLPPFGINTPLRLSFMGNGQLIADDQRTMTPLRQWLRVELSADCRVGRWSARVAGEAVVTDTRFQHDVKWIHRISFRTGPWRSIGGKQPIEHGTDRPANASSYSVRRLTIHPA